ncbi:MAG TPA: D-glycero-beta-D-manno-heptose 1-phosphate adenylyltransferase [Bacteroidales bacterium]|jgi:rfaE bifunctional protein nucleotidyltransferase chain/domain|nr:D-glycero-beta-D-manno-heptose 1-phosphate adenylyltransferase [Bacteroidales bacterium]
MKNIKQIEKKIVTRNDWEKLKNHFQSKKIVFTNGCFDILHLGHVHYLSAAKDLGDILVIGLNSDDSVKRLKGENRPMNTQYARALLLAALQFVDFVIVFDEDTPLNLIQQITPHVLVKGGDYKIEDVVGAEWVMAHGGKVEIVDFVEGYSSTNLIKKKNML